MPRLRRWLCLGFLCLGYPSIGVHSAPPVAEPHPIREKGQAALKRGDVDEAQSAFERLISRAPAELRFPGSAAEAMLSIKQPAKALQFAQKGLAKAREKNDRDSEDYFKELVVAAERQERG